MNAPPDPSDEQYRGLAHFRYGLRLFLRFSEDAARAAGVTPAQHQLLLAVRGGGVDGPVTVSRLAELLVTRSNSTVELVDRAEAAGLVTRRDDPDDARRSLVELTERGAEILRALSVLHAEELRRFRRGVLPLLEPLG